jgi:Myosin-like coiled-coil protein
MQSNTEQNNKLREENKALADRFKIICEQYELRESVCIDITISGNV